jgi:hypothetical protein
MESASTASADGPGGESNAQGASHGPAPRRTYEMSGGVASGRSGQLLYDQYRRLVGVVVAYAEHSKRAAWA